MPFAPGATVAGTNDASPSATASKAAFTLFFTLTP
jgi:hypothetical protein